jgi:transcriptional regulator with XRE-family HTH domain
MSEPVMSSELIRAARALIRWEQKELADASGVSLPTIKRLETKPGPLSAHPQTIASLKQALESAGVEFTNGGKPGVRLGSGAAVGAISSTMPIEGLNAENDE